MRYFLTVFVFIFSLVLTLQSLAGEHFTVRRFDRLVPENCRNVEMGFFPNLNQIYFETYGLQGASRLGFTHEVNLHRKEAQKLWEIMKEDKHNSPETHRYLRKHPNAFKAYNALINAHAYFGFNWQIEGEILEALVLMHLLSEFPEGYYVTGGIEYHERRGGTLGEIDIVVARSLDCKVLMIGEAKLGNNLSKAQRQLNRIRRFISRH